MEIDTEGKELKMMESLSELKGKLVLEIGCGDGRFSRSLVGKVKKLIAIDPDKNSIKKAKSTIRGVDFRIGTGEDLEFENMQFDIIIFTYSLHHQDGKRALREAHRVLKKNGQLIIIEPANDGEVSSFFNLIKDEKKN